MTKMITDLSDVSVDDLDSIQGTRLLLHVDQGSARVAEWAAENHEHVERLLQANGALLIRGLKFAASQQFGVALATLFDAELLEYVYRSTPRTQLRGNVYTATEYHPSLQIPQHNENAYGNRWAMRLGFLCTVPSEQGGATPICNSELVYQQIPDAIRDRFERDGVMYVRNYSDIDVHWNDVFQTEKRDEVERFCQANQISHEWLEGNRLRTRQINQASIRHPVTGAQVWFNQAHLFHVSNLDEELQKNLLATVGEADLPRNTYYGDGAPIATSDLALIRSIYQRHAIRFDWQRNDLLLLDNMLYSHGRDSFVGDRQVLVGMARSIDADSVESRP